MFTRRQITGICMHWSPEVLLLINLAYVLSYTPEKRVKMVWDFKDPVVQIGLTHWIGMTLN